MTAVLSARGLTRTFSGLLAVDDVSVDIEAGEVRGLIGSNGAGKSTLLSLIYGQLEPDAGTIHFAGSDITRIPAGKRARLGMGLVPQVTSLFEDLTVEQNLVLGGLPKEPHTPLSLDRAEVNRIVELLDLHDLRFIRAGHLSHGEQRWLEIGMVLLSKPRLFLLDEPTSGMTMAESRKTASLLRGLQASEAVQSMIIVEHNIEFIRLVSDRVTVMHRGAVLAAGTIDEVKANPQVQASYLGRLR